MAKLTKSQQNLKKLVSNHLEGDYWQFKASNKCNRTEDDFFFITYPQNDWMVFSIYNTKTISGSCVFFVKMKRGSYRFFVQSNKMFSNLKREDGIEAKEYKDLVLLIKDHLNKRGIFSKDEMVIKDIIT